MLAAAGDKAVLGWLERSRPNAQANRLSGHRATGMRVSQKAQPKVMSETPGGHELVQRGALSGLDARQRRFQCFHLPLCPQLQACTQTFPAHHAWRQYCAPNVIAATAHAACHLVNMSHSTMTSGYSNCRHRTCSAYWNSKAMSEAAAPPACCRRLPLPPCRHPGVEAAREPCRRNGVLLARRGRRCSAHEHVAEPIWITRQSQLNATAAWHGDRRDRCCKAGCSDVQQLQTCTQGASSGDEHPERYPAAGRGAYSRE